MYGQRIRIEHGIALLAAKLARGMSQHPVFNELD